MSRAGAACAALLYAGFILHSALAGFGASTPPGALGWSWSTAFAMPARISRADLLVNVAGYVPFGFLLAGLLGTTARASRAASWLGATAIAASLSAITELLQTAMPGRNSSIVDLGANSLGALVGAVAQLGWQRLFAGAGGGVSASVRRPAGGHLPGVALGALLLWVADRWWPMLFTLDPGSVRSALRPVKAWWLGDTPFEPLLALRYLGLHLAALLVAAGAWAAARTRWLLPPVLEAAALGGKLLAARTLRIEELAAAFAALVLVLALRHVPGRLVAWAGAGACTVGLVLTQLASGVAAGAQAAPLPFNWAPFAATLARTDLGIAPYLTLAALLGPLAWFAWQLARPAGALVPGSTLAVAGAVLALEWAQTRITGRQGDVTLVIVAAAGWLALARAARAEQVGGRAGSSAAQPTEDSPAVGSR